MAWLLRVGGGLDSKCLGTANTSEERTMSSGQPREIARSAFWREAGLLLRLLRERQGWGYPELAERAGVTSDLVVAYELARERYPEVEACMRLTAALGVTLAAFLREAER